MRLTKTDTAAMDGLTIWIICLLAILLLINVGFITYTVVIGHKESKRLAKIAKDKLAWEGYQDAYEKQLAEDEIEESDEESDEDAEATIDTSMNSSKLIEIEPRKPHSRTQKIDLKLPAIVEEVHEEDKKEDEKEEKEEDKKEEITELIWVEEAPEVVDEADKEDDEKAMAEIEAEMIQPPIVEYEG